MNLTIIILTVVCVENVLSLDKSIGKCCTRDCEISENDSKYQCVPHTRRLEMLVESYKVLEDLEDGKCVDSEGDNFFVYDVKNSSIVGKSELEETYFPKCCPLGLVYNSENRGCVQSASATEEFIKEQFIKVGLPKCQLITDKKLDNFTELSTILNRSDTTLGSFCIDKNDQSNFVLRICQTNLNICQTKRCLRKCCPDGQSYIKDGNVSTCQDTYIFGLNIKNHYLKDDIENVSGTFEVIYNTGCSKFNQLEKNSISYSINRNGTYRYFSNFSNSYFEKDYDHPESYCIEYSYEKNKLALGRYYVYECEQEEKYPRDDSYLVIIGVKISSALFLVVCILLTLKTISENIVFKILLINYCSAMILGMLSSSLIPFPDIVQFGYPVTVFSSYASIAWITILSFNVWKNVKKLDNLQKPVKPTSTGRQILIYSMLGWGLPLGFVLLILIFDFARIFPESMKFFVGASILNCDFLSRNYARIIFLLIPELIVQICNMVLIFSTLSYLVKTNNASSKNLSVIAQNEWLMVTIKLTILTSFSFILDVILSSFDLKCRHSKNIHIDVIFEVLMSLQGAFTLILLFGKKLTKLLCKNNKSKNTEIISVETVTSDMSSPTSPLSENEKQH